MRKYIYIIMCVIGTLGMASCSETDDSVNDFNNWQERNEAYFEQIYQKAADSIAAGNANWRIIKSLSKAQGNEGVHTDYIVVNVLKSSDKTASPEFSDTVRIHYRGNLMPSESYPETGYEFETTWYGKYDVTTMIPKKMAVSGLIDGFSTALQYMHPGDRWMIYLPHQRAYGKEASSTIPAYSMLKYDLTLQSFGKPGTPMPAFQ